MAHRPPIDTRRAPRQAWAVVGRYAVAVGLAAAAVALTVALAALLPRSVFVFAFAAVAVAARVGGVGPGLVTALLCVLGIDYYLIPPTRAFRPADPADVVPLGVFILVAALIGTLTQALRTARDAATARAGEAEDAARTVRQQADELELANQQLQEQQTELEAQATELEAQADVLQTTVAELEIRTEEAEAARAAADGARAVTGALVESVRDAFVAYDAEFRFTYVNAAAEALFATVVEGPPLVGRVLWEAYPRLLGTPVEAAMRRAMTERVPVQFDTHDPVLRRSYAARVYPAADGGLTAMWADVSAERRAEEAARFLAEASRMLGASLDYHATLRAVAEAAVPRLGDWCAVDIVRDPTARAWPPTVERLAVVHQDPAMLALGEELTRRYPTDWTEAGGMAGVLRDGTPFVVPEVTDAMVVAGARDAEHLALLRALRFSSVLVVPLVARGLTLGALTLCMTESARRYDDADRALALEVAGRAALAVDNARLYRDAERARAEAEAASRVKGEFLANMSHELRTPLNAIGGHVQLLELGLHGPLTEEQRAALGRVQGASRHLLGLINDVLNYAKLEAGRVEYALGVVELRDVLAASTPLVEPQRRAKGLAFAVELPETGCRVWADPDKLAQVLLNLLSNAVKFTPDGGAITVRVAAPEDPAVTLIEVTDTGVGIPAAKLDAVFEPFVQVSASRARGHEGTGLGLTISRDLARGMGGDLHVRSREGVGSTFTVSLRRVRDGDGDGEPADRRPADLALPPAAPRLPSA